MGPRKARTIACGCRPYCFCCTRSNVPRMGLHNSPYLGHQPSLIPPHLSARKTARKNVNANSQASRNSGRNDSKSRSWRRGGRWRWWSGKAFSPKPSPPLPPPPWWYPTSHTHTERDIEKDGERESKRGRGRGKDVICFTWKNGAEQPCEKNLNPETGTKTRLLCFFSFSSSFRSWTADRAELRCIRMRYIQNSGPGLGPGLGPAEAPQRTCFYVYVIVCARLSLSGCSTTTDSPPLLLQLDCSTLDSTRGVAGVDVVTMWLTALLRSAKFIYASS